MDWITLRRMTLAVLAAGLMAPAPATGQAVAARSNESAALVAKGLELGYSLDYEDALTAFRAEIIAERAPEPPTRVVSASLRFHLEGNVPPAAVERAIALSRDKYCSVWHSLRPDIQLTTAYDITP